MKMTHTVTIDLDFGILGEVPVEVEFSYWAGERQTRDEPGSEPEYNIISMTAAFYDSNANVTDYVPLDGYDIDQKIIIEALEAYRDDYCDD